MKFRHGWAFPDEDRFMVAELAADGTYQAANLDAALRLVTQRGCAIDGGAHVGTWAKRLSGLFDRVHAFEPSPDTFECLAYNLRRSGCFNVTTHQAALGNRPGTIALTLDAANEARGNTGARHVTDGVDVPVVTIDSLQLDRVGLIKLDVEGSEPLALEGAAATIARCRPIVLFENKKLWSRYFGMRKDAVSLLLTSYGYRHRATASCDEIWGPR